MKTVYKYELNRSGLKEITLPEGSWIVKAAIQYDDICIWAVVDTKEINRKVHKFVVLGTGWEIPCKHMDHIDTILEGPYVWHVFEIFD
jgi:hypothetical protein